ncbi:MAG: hypothetical protein ACOY3I_09485 [Verrucomicrobiota bacterium]
MRKECVWDLEFGIWDFEFRMFQEMTSDIPYGSRPSMIRSAKIEETSAF